jgi:hypothetical protein
MPDVGQNLRERNLTLCLNGSKVFENYLTTVFTVYPSVFKKPEVVNELHRLYDNFDLVPADKASNDIVLFCKTYYYEFYFNELGFTSTSGNPTYTQTSLTKDEILQNHLSALNIFYIPKNQDRFELPYLYWIPILHKNPYKERYIAGSS